ncbi:uncharacterized protein GGS22DRAFT_159752 [Annulohypoxylon maeteangense]|uniref:uncharacterized protein n=1 Tax=Annulohypoxylon maeteangense TaxID=1927788 RepID=UPI0020080712|nr:uncharacterized protein GGS22DRAFT_159752 [Annulohypoxylon maeteangense]KAI0886060.1 hypothetical protein GGS22DRAFT_159752 [Annulohypoxylon maeteangense]
MAAETTRCHSMPASSFYKLSMELLIFIFHQLRDIDSRALANVRQLSKRFEAIVTPICFESIYLNERIIAPETEICFPRVIQSLCSFTRHVEVNSDLDPVATRRLLDRLQRLSSLRWCYVRTHCSGNFTMPCNILGLKHVHNNIRLYVEDLPLHGFNGDSHALNFQGIPTSSLVSLKMFASIPSLTSCLGSLKRLLLESRSIETFHHDDHGQGTQFSFKGNERLPAFRELSLRSYDWNHSISEVEKHWDFSRLRRLILVDVPLFSFLNSVPFTHLHQLHTLHCEDFSTHLPDQRQETTRILYKLALQIRALHTFKVTCHTTLFPVSGILVHADSLRILRFRDYVGFGDEIRRCPTMQAEDLSLLSRKLRYLHTIELDMDVDLCEPALFIRALCKFPQLDTLVLHTQTVLQTLEENQGSADPDYDASMKIFSALMSGKQGKLWRSITINVGGWKPVMVRRISESWQQQNRRGFFAERCFVLEKDTDNVEVEVREKMGVDNSPVCR